MTDEVVLDDTKHYSEFQDILKKIKEAKED